MINRRNFLRTSALGAGAFAMAPSSLFAASGHGIPKRFIFMRKCSGILPHALALPSFSAKEKELDSNKQAFEADLDKHELPKCLNVLNEYKEHMSVIQGLSSKICDNGHFSFSSVMGCYKMGKSGLSGIKRATVDYELAKLYPSPFGHIELSMSGNKPGIKSGFAAPAPHRRNTAYGDPETAYNEIFKSVLQPGLMDNSNAMLKFLKSKEASVASGLRGLEKLKLSTQLHSIEALRNRNLQLKKMSSSVAKFLPQLDPIHKNGGEKATTVQRLEGLTDVLVASLASGLTNVVQYTLDNLQAPITGLPDLGKFVVDIHAVGHGGSFGGFDALTLREKIRISHTTQIKTIIDKLKKIPEGDGNMFDNTMIMYFPEGGETHHGKGTESPWIVMSGKNCQLDTAGRYTRLPSHGTEGHKTLGNWYTTLLNAHGNPIKHYGDLDQEMSRKKLHQTGSIKRFLG
jgi:hypothetical protein